MEDYMDFEEVLEKYNPFPEDTADREFIESLKTWIKQIIFRIAEDDIYVMCICFVMGADADEDIEVCFAYNTESFYNMHRGERWNFCNWKEDYMDVLDGSVMKKWLEMKSGFEDENKVMEKLSDLAVIAVAEINSENIICGRLGRKVPVIMTDYEYYYMTAVRAVKANGYDVFDREFFEYCGLEID